MTGYLGRLPDAATATSQSQMLLPCAERGGRHRRSAAVRQADTPDVVREEVITMPVPPPKPTTEHRDRIRDHEVAQVLRALRAEGPQSSDELAIGRRQVLG